MYTNHSCHLLVLMYHVSFIEPVRKFPPFRGWLSFCQHVTEESVFGKVGVKMWVNNLVENLVEEWLPPLRAYDKKMSHALVDTILGKQGKVTTTWRYHFLVNFDDYCDFLNYFPSVFWYPHLPSFSLYFVLLIFMIFFFFPVFFFFFTQVSLIFLIVINALATNLRGVLFPDDSTELFYLHAIASGF